jgi:hypothetical protein
MFVVVLYGYQIYEFQIGLRFILSLNSVCKGIKLYFDTWQKYAGDSSKLHLNFATDQRESEVNLHKRLLRPKA